MLAAPRARSTIALYHRNAGGPPQLIAPARHPPPASAAAATSAAAGSRCQPGRPPRPVSADAQGLVFFAAGALVTAAGALLYRALARSRRRAGGSSGRRPTELEYRALHDALTGLPNRTLVLDRAEQVLARARRRDVPVTALFMDIDGFKQINDRFGHKAGDEVLRQLGARLRTVLRGSDTVGRLGGDEFVMVLDCDGREAADPARVAERILDVLRQPLELPAPGTHRCRSRPASASPRRWRTRRRTCCAEADIAMYQAKAAGKGGYVVFESAMEAAARTRASLELDLADALEADQLFLDYQPVVSLKTGRVEASSATSRPGLCTPPRRRARGNLSAPRCAETATAAQPPHGSEIYGCNERLARRRLAARTFERSAQCHFAPRRRSTSRLPRSRRSST